MKGAKEFLKTHEIMPRISFQDRLEHTLTLINSKPDSIKDSTTGEPIDGVKFLVEEGGERKTVFSGSAELIQKLAEYEEGTVVKVQMITRSTAAGPKTGYKVEAVSLPDGSAPVQPDKNPNGTLKPKPKAEPIDPAPKVPAIDADTNEEINPEEIPF